MIVTAILTFFVWFMTFALVVLAVVCGVRATKALSDMQNYVNAKRDADKRLEIRYSFDVYKITDAYKELSPDRRYLTKYNFSMFGFAISIIFAVGFFLVNIWYLNPVKSVPDRPYLHESANEIPGEARD